MTTPQRDRYRPYFGALGHRALLALACLVVPLFYRLRVENKQLPDGPVIYAPNHVTYVDAILLSVAMRKRIRFIMTARLYDTWFIKPFLRLAGAIPIRPRSEDPQCLERAYEAVEAALAAGEQVCIFPEGRLTPTGDIEAFKKGIARIAARSGAPVVPVGLGGLWGSRWSHAKAPRNWRRRTVDVVGGQAIAPDALETSALHMQVAALRSAA